MIAANLCKSVPIGVPLNTAASVMLNEHKAILMGGGKELAFIALRTPEGCACHVNLDSAGTTTGVSSKCVQ
ncbi:hypothetical protein [Pseudoduganella ginsengisoli]|uniref:Uncharacterized protein n=1 Tax=Pseudoduganella ginsengisoli TaxID=1462440 RepID=A0A6L6Q119_9BURK|nr:hypothetical protein [Pseudoduganella ginsengisoli]MTW03236.1 hypothetical protein [Pseudoduganella ginsengisoli]